MRSVIPLSQGCQNSSSNRDHDNNCTIEMEARQEYSLGAAKIDSRVSNVTSASNKFSDAKEAYEDFINERNRFKKALYYKISLVGIILFSIGFITYVLCKILASYKDPHSIFPVASAAGLIILMVGMLCISFVPFDEVDIEESASTPVKVLLLLIWGSTHCYMAVIPPYLEFISVACCVAEIISQLILKPRNPLPFFNIKFSFLLGLSLFGVIPSLYMLTFDVKYLSRKALLNGISWLKMPIWVGILMGTSFLLLSLWIFYHVALEVKLFLRNNCTPILQNNFPLFIHCAYLYIGGAGLYHLCIGISSLQISDETVNAKCFVGIGIIFVISVATVNYLTPSVIYTFLSRQFDYSSGRMDIDCSFLAELVLTNYFQIGATYYIQRVSDSKLNEIFFEEGRIVGVFNDCIEVVPITVQSGIIHKVPLSQNLLNRSDLLEWAKQNIRLLQWKDFKNEFLFSSPRELKSDEEKSIMYSFSQPLEQGKKIDYFISHSWNDDRVVKVNKLREYMDAQNNCKTITLWLDKICIDQKNPTQSLQVLPINISSCEKFLILWGESYINRLWCVWELYTLFAFCRPEVAMERLEVIVLNDSMGNSNDRLILLAEKLEHFTLDDAHCFDPNEENKLRHLISTVGKEKFEFSVHCIGNRLKKKHSKAHSLN